MKINTSPYFNIHYGDTDRLYSETLYQVNLC